MNKIIIKQANHRGADTKVFRAYAVPTAERPGYFRYLAVQASSTIDPASTGARYCAFKAFKKLVEPSAEREELETRIALKELSGGARIWEATLQPKSPCDTLSDLRPVKTWFSVEMAMPDSDLTVMIHAPATENPIWIGYHDGECWREISGDAFGEGEVTHWMDLPNPPL